MGTNKALSVFEYPVGIQVYNRWLVIAHEAGNSGAPRMLLEVLRGVRACLGPTWSCEIVLSRGGVLDAEFAKLGRVHCIGHPWAEGTGRLAWLFRVWIEQPWLKPKKFRRLVAEFMAKGSGVIYSNTGINGRLLAELPQDCGPVVSHIHELGATMVMFSREREVATTLARTTLFLTVSSGVEEDLRALGVKDTRMRRIPNFITSMPAVPDREAARSEVLRRLGLSGQLRFVVGCGHIDPIKGTDIFTETARLVSLEKGDSVVFIWLGGVSHQIFAQQVKAVAAGSVLFLGEVADTSVYFAASEVVIVTSRMESFSRVALEAGALGRPVLAFAGARGPADLLDHDSLIAETSAVAMAAAVLGVLGNQVRADESGMRLRARIAEHFMADKWIGELLASIEGISNDGFASIDSA